MRLFSSQPRPSTGRRIGFLVRSVRALAALLASTVILDAADGVRLEAATTTANLSVQLTVTATCTVSAATLNFGSTGLLSSLIDAQTNLSVTCTNSTPYSVGLGNGSNYSSGRRMSDGASHFIPYEVYTDSGRSTVWTTASSSTACTTSNSCALGTGNGSAQAITVYGRVPALGTAPVAGSYTDTLVITVTY